MFLRCETLRKRSVESAEEILAANVTPVMMEVKPIAAFNYWTPGWFWEISLIVIIVFGIGMPAILLILVIRIDGLFAYSFYSLISRCFWNLSVVCVTSYLQISPTEKTKDLVELLFNIYLKYENKFLIFQRVVP